MSELPASENDKPKKARRRSVIRENHEARILQVAEDLFARNGFNGTAVDSIAEAAGMSKQNMLYYFPSKEILYRRVLQQILDLWVEKMVLLLDQDGGEPAEILEDYIRRKVEMSRTHPNGSKVFANEIINGAPYLREYLQENLIDSLEKDVALVRSWIEAGKMDPVDPYHLFFVIWASTQTYADFSTQICLVMKKDALEDTDYQGASDFIANVILKGIGLR